MPDTSITLELCGPPRARHGGQTYALSAPDGLLLAWLALEGPTSRERLAALLWPASETEAARNALRQRLFRLRRQLGRDVVEGSVTVRLAAGVAHDLRDAATVLGDVAAVDAPELEQWLAARRAAQGAQARQAREVCIETLEAAGDLAGALSQALALLDADALSEDAHRRVMRLHYLRGDRAAAMLAFDRCEQLLKHEIGTSPSRQTLALLATVEQSAPLADGAWARGAVPAAVLRPPRLIGRDAELAALRRALSAGQVVVLVAEAGMGKSRLLQALAATQAGVLHSSGRPGDALVPYATLVRALRQVLDRDPAAVDAGLRRALSPLLPELAGDQPVPALRHPLTQPVLALLQRAGRSIDTLALDDLHFADDATLELLQALLATPRGSAGRPDEGPRWCLGLRPAAPATRLHGLLVALATAGPHLRLALQPLTEPQMAEFIDSLALPGVAGAAIAGALCQRTGGNPLFTLETLKLAWSDGSLHTLAAGEDLPRPDTLAQLIGQQLARLSPPALKLARVAAVAGVDFGIALAGQLLECSALDLADPWAELESQQVLRGDAFAHDLIHDAVLQGLPEVIARHLHGQTAAWLEQQGGEPARVAAHWEAAGQRARALPALRAAAESAHRALREGERIAFLLRAADIAEAAERPDEAFALVRNAVEGHMDTIRQADGLPLLERMQALARTPLQRAQLASDRAWYSAVLGNFTDAVTQGEDALRLAQPLGDEGLLATLRQRLGTVLSMTGRFEAALLHMRTAEAWIRTDASSVDTAEFHDNLAVVLTNLGRPDEAQPHYEQALAISRANGDHAQQATAMANYAGSRLDAGDLTLASAQVAHAQRIVATYDMAGSSAGFIATLQAQCERAAGHYTAAVEWCQRAEGILAERNPSRVPVARLHLAHVWLDLGQHARALQVLGGPALSAARQMPARYAVRWLVLLARVQRRLRTNVATLLADAAALAPADGWPELQLIVRTEQALALEAAPAVRQLESVAAAAQGLRLHGAELGALLHAAALAAEQQMPQAAALARRALALADRAEALHTDRALRWLATAEALASCGETDAAAALAAAGQAWLRTTAAVHVAPEFADSFLHQHPLHLRLLAWPAGR